MDKYIYYTITPTEQLFKQLAGFLYFLMISKTSNKILVLPRFELKNKFYNYEDLFDFDSINNNFNVITFNKYVQISKLNQSISANTDCYIHGVWQLPFSTHNYMDYRKYVKYNKKFYNVFSSPEKYLSIHWRQEDFLKVRPQVVMNKEELVRYAKYKLKELNLTKVYIATNSDVPEDLNYIHKNLPTFKYPKENMSNIDYAILETLICTKATYFIGTDTSLYSTYIIGERINLNKDTHEIFKKII